MDTSKQHNQEDRPEEHDEEVELAEEQHADGRYYQRK